jgi:hypothetical protein
MFPRSKEATSMLLKENESHVGYLSTASLTELLVGSSA